MGSTALAVDSADALHVLWNNVGQDGQGHANYGTFSTSTGANTAVARA